MYEKKEMRLRKLGKKYKFTQGTIYNNYKNVDIKSSILKHIDTVLEYILSIEKIEPHSVYLRGSCVEESEFALDLDIIILYDKRFNEAGNYGFELSNGHCSYGEQLKELSNRINMYADIDFRTVEDFAKDIETRFFCKKVYGYNDLSLSKLEAKDILVSLDLPQDHKDLPGLKAILYGEITADKNVLNILMKRYIKDFYRRFGLISLLKNNMYSTSIYQCHQALLLDMPYLKEKLETILDAFLNTEAYSHKLLRALIHDISHLAEECGYIKQKEIKNGGS